MEGVSVMIDVREIMQIMPHRYPFLLVDRIESLKEGEEIVGIKNVTINEPFRWGASLPFTPARKNGLAASSTLWALTR
jgi:hypothetical protein